jgi:hypothetical protein
MRHQLLSDRLSRRVLCVVSPKGDVVCPAFARATASVTLVPVGVRPGSRTIQRPHLRNSLIPRRRDDLAARLRAFLGAADVHVPLTLALVLSLAGIARSRAASLTFARVDARAVHLHAGLVLGPRQDVSSKYQTRRGARDQHPSFACAFLSLLWLGWLSSCSRGFVPSCVWLQSARRPGSTPAGLFKALG